MIPYVTLSPIFLAPWRLQPFALLVSAGILVGHFLLIARAHRLGLRRAWAAEMSLVMVLCGFAGAVLFKLVYRPDLWATLSWQTVPGISSFGGLAGGLLGGFTYLKARGAAASERHRYFEVVGFVFPFAFAFGRLGCALTHDHPGLRSDSGWLTVAYPDGARWDLGVLEFLFLIALASLFTYLDRRGAPHFLAMLLMTYGVFRVALDQLHVDPPRYAGISVDQWAGVFAAGSGLLLWWQRRRADQSHSL